MLSGYLITTLLLNEREHTGTISLRRFYQRRALRLLPALLVSLTGGTILAVAFGAPSSDYIWLGYAFMVAEDSRIYASFGPVAAGFSPSSALLSRVSKGTNLCCHCCSARTGSVPTEQAQTWLDPHY